MTSWRRIYLKRYAADDADCLTVGTTLKLAKQTANAFFGEDTGLLLLSIGSRSTWALQSFVLDRYKVCSQSLGRNSSPDSNSSRDICENILFGHAVGGYDTQVALSL